MASKYSVSDRKGIIRLDPAEFENPFVLPEIFHLLQFTVYRAEYLLCYKAIEYQGVSPRFEVCLLGQRLPEYELFIERGPDKAVKSVVCKRER